MTYVYVINYASLPADNTHVIEASYFKFVS